MFCVALSLALATQFALRKTGETEAAACERGGQVNGDRWSAAICAITTTSNGPSQPIGRWRRCTLPPMACVGESTAEPAKYYDDYIGGEGPHQSAARHLWSQSADRVSAPAPKITLQGL